MNQEIKLQKFEGPLDLLLQLIEREEMSINEVALSKVTEEFLNYLDKLDEDRSEALADFFGYCHQIGLFKIPQFAPVAPRGRR